MAQQLYALVEIEGGIAEVDLPDEVPLFLIDWDGIDDSFDEDYARDKWEELAGAAAFLPADRVERIRAAMRTAAGKRGVDLNEADL